MLHKEIINWLKDYAIKSGMQGFVVGISGGIDSSVVSTLCAETGLKTIAVSLPINQDKILDSRSELHKSWLKQKYSNVEDMRVDLSEIFEKFKSTLETSQLGLANTKSRLRMVALYGIAASDKLLVAGTGNKVEDFGVGFFTKYGDGGVDLSPIGDLMKSEVYALARELNILQEIQDAKPTDGLWDDNRTDEDQLGASYDELEWAMLFNDDYEISDRQKEVLEIYKKFRNMNYHKMIPIPIFKNSSRVNKEN
jgi:NAD+ synthase